MVELIVIHHNDEYEIRMWPETLIIDDPINLILEVDDLIHQIPETDADEVDDL